MDERTVTNELQNGSTQSSLACTSCRKKKLKCDRSVPQCRNCQKASRSCEYPAVAHKPGPRPGTHRRTGDSHSSKKSKCRSSAPHASNSEGTPNYSDSQANAHTVGVYNTPSDTVQSHGSHENQKSPAFQYSTTGELVFRSACNMMGLSERSCLRMIEVYFESVTSFSLFHPPTFMTKLANIESPKQLQALLTAMFAFSVRFMDADDLALDRQFQPSGILESAYLASHECLRECSDEAPPLHLLQSLLLQALLFSTLGVRGRAWRLVGQCIRTAYELRLHELDVELPGRTETDTNWTATEEKRRAWWATWECDVFASTIQRLPNQIDWTRNRTLLPVSDHAWYNSEPAQSCYLHVDPNRRWRDLRDTGNTSPIAWFTTINSYKWESLSVTHRIAPPTTFFDNDNHPKDPNDCINHRPVLSRKREMLENCLRCTIGAIPTALQPNGFLTFDRSRGSFPGLTRLQDHGKFMVHIMCQVTRLLLSRNSLEGGNYIAFPLDFTQAGPVNTNNEQTRIERQRWQQCLLASDQMAQLVRNSSPDHHRYVNPNMATALWMAAATQLAVLAFHRDEIDVGLAQSNLDLLTTTIESFINFWDVPKTLVQSLATLEQHLRFVTSKQLPNGATGDVYNGHKAGPERQDNTHVNEVRQSQPMAEFSNAGMPHGETGFDLSPFDVLQAMDFGAMYNGVENWENLFLDPGFYSLELNS